MEKRSANRRARARSREPTATTRWSVPSRRAVTIDAAMRPQPSTPHRSTGASRASRVRGEGSMVVIVGRWQDRSMDLTLTEDQRSFRALAREFLDREVVPYRAEWDRVESV